MRRIFAAALIAVPGLYLAGCSSLKVSANEGQQKAATPAATPTAPVKVAVAETRTMPVEITATGNAEAYSTISVKAQIGGNLTKVNFREGDLVQKGQLLFEIDSRPYEETIRQAEANLARDQAQLAEDEARLTSARAQEEHYGKQADRYSRLADQGIFSREQADQMGVELKSRRSNVKVSTAAIESSKAAIRADQAAIAAAKLNLSYCRIHSPITGRTGNLLVKQGNLVKANDVELVTIHQFQPIYVSFSIPEFNLPTVRRYASAGKLPVSASFPGDVAGTPSQGSVTFVNNAVDKATGTIQLKATFTNTDARLWPGQYVDVRLRLAERPNAVVIPAAALQTGQQGTYLYVVKPDQTVEIRVVTTGPRLQGAVAIDTGLNAGETVVTEGQLRLAPGYKVKVTS